MGEYEGPSEKRHQPPNIFSGSDALSGRRNPAIVSHIDVCRCIHDLLLRQETQEHEELVVFPRFSEHKFVAGDVCLDAVLDPRTP